MHEEEEQKYVEANSPDYEGTYEEQYAAQEDEDFEQSPQKSPESNNPHSAQNEREPMLYVDVNLG